MTVYLEDTDCTLHHGDALEVLRELPDESVDAIVTSPPYADARPDVITISPSAYADWLKPFLVCLIPVLRPTGSLMLNIGRVFRGGEEQPIAWAALEAACEVGWKLIDTVLWHKTKAVPKAGPYLHDRHEYVWWLARDTHAYRGYDETRVPHSPQTVARYSRGNLRGQKGQPYRERPPLHPLGPVPPSVFMSAVGARAGNGHPSPMDERFAAHLIRLSCPYGGTVLDPFVGSGTTCHVARKLNRRSVGIDLNAEYLALAADRLAQLSLLAEAN